MAAVIGRIGKATIGPHSGGPVSVRMGATRHRPSGAAVPVSMGPTRRSTVPVSMGPTRRSASSAASPQGAASAAASSGPSSASGSKGKIRNAMKKVNSSFKDREVMGMKVSGRTQKGILLGGAVAGGVMNRRGQGTSSGSQSIYRY